MSPQHTSGEYEVELRQLREGLLSMAGRVEHMIAGSVMALVDRDSDLARRTIEEDRLVDRSELEIDGLCLRTLARRQPMASDLRFITLALKMVTDLERIGDLAVNICERAIDLNAAPILKPYVDVPRMAKIVQSMVRDAINAFIVADAATARDVLKRDNEVDALYRRVFLEVLGLMRQDPEVVERGVHVQSVAKWLERMADHATNLAEQVIFLTEGEDIRHRYGM